MTESEMRALCGWVPFEERTAEQNEAHEAIVAAMPDFRVEGVARANDGVKKVLLTDLWVHEQVVRALGFAFPRIHQKTGSCVGAGLGNAGFSLCCVEVIRLGEPEQIIVPFWPLPYGKSRQLGGMRGRGEGSFGSSAAEAVKRWGFLDARMEGLPPFRVEDGLVWGERVEYEWSDGAAIPEHYLEAASRKVVRTTSRLKSADEVRESIRNLYPVTMACPGFVARPRVHGEGADAVLVGSLDGKGGHQTSILGWQEHPQLGELFLYSNQWPESAYPRDPAGGPPCSCWLTAATVDRVCRDRFGEVYNYSQYQGYPAQEIPWAF